jgi:hypothetical protein
MLEIRRRVEAAMACMLEENRYVTKDARASSEAMHAPSGQSRVGQKRK